MYEASKLATDPPNFGRSVGSCSGQVTCGGGAGGRGSGVGERAVALVRGRLLLASVDTACGWDFRFEAFDGCALIGLALARPVVETSIVSASSAISMSCTTLALALPLLLLLLLLTLTGVVSVLRSSFTMIGPPRIRLLLRVPSGSVSCLVSAAVAFDPEA